MLSMNDVGCVWDGCEVIGAMLPERRYYVYILSSKSQVIYGGMTASSWRERCDIRRVKAVSLRG
jgi:L-amino acid N-acyltransferase YncA